MILKDASPYNVQFKGAKPVFVDVGSFERLREGEPWVGYRQFCMLYLYPLLLQAVKDVELHARCLRGNDRRHHPGPDARPGDASATASARASTSTSSCTRKLEAKHADRGRRGQGRGQEGRLQEGADRGQRARHAQAGRAARVEPAPGRAGWPTASATATPTTTPSARTSSCARWPPRQRWGLTWDIGCQQRPLLADRRRGLATHVLAVDADQGPIELLYRTLRDEGDEKHPHAHHEPGRPVARPGLARRWSARPWPSAASPTCVLALALIHHVTIAANVPVAEFVDWLASLGTSLVIEFPTREDPMVKKLLGPKRDGLHPDYERENFERVLAERLRRRAPRAPRVRHPAAVLRPAQGHGARSTSPPRGLMGGRRPPARARLPGVKEALLAFGHLAVLLRRSRSPSRCSTCSPTTRSSSPRAAPPPARSSSSRCWWCWCRRSCCC